MVELLKVHWVPFAPWQVAGSCSNEATEVILFMGSVGSHTPQPAAGTRSPYIAKLSTKACLDCGWQHLVKVFFLLTGLV